MLTEQLFLCIDFQFYSTHTVVHTEQKQAQASNKTTQGLILLFPIDTAKGSIMGLLQATCIMPNSSGWFAVFLIQQPPHPCDSKQQQEPTGDKPPLGLGWHFQPLVTLHFLRTEVRVWGRGHESRGERRGEGPCDLVQMERLVVIPLKQTIMWSHY